MTENEKTLMARIDNYMLVIEDFRNHGLKTYRQMKGDLKEIEARCEMNGIEFEPLKKYYIEKGRVYF